MLTDKCGWVVMTKVSLKLSTDYSPSTSAKLERLESTETFFLGLNHLMKLELVALKRLRSRVTVIGRLLESEEKKKKNFKVFL
jgi:hypothetical protein